MALSTNYSQKFAIQHHAEHKNREEIKSGKIDEECMSLQTNEGYFLRDVKSKWRVSEKKEVETYSHPTKVGGVKPTKFFRDPKPTNLFTHQP